MNKPETLDIVIVNWNSGTQLRECLQSITLCSLDGVDLRKVVVVDNGSTDGSMTGIRVSDLPLLTILNPVNRGFAAACNQGADAGEADWVLFLNPDVRLMQTSLTAPLRFRRRFEGNKPGILGIQLVDEEGNISRSCARFPTPKTLLLQMLGLDRFMPGRIPGHFMNRWDHGQNRCVDQVMGAFFLVRRTLFETLGGFDERFFVYYEDMDFSLRALRAGHPTWFVADGRAFHRGCGTTDAVPDQRIHYFLRSRILYGYKHFGKVHGNLLMAATLAVEPLARLALALLHSAAARTDIVHTLRGFALLVKDSPRVFFAGNTGRHQKAW